MMAGRVVRVGFSPAQEFDEITDIAVEDLDQTELEGRLSNADAESPSVVVLSTSQEPVLQLARRVHTAWPVAHLLFVCEPGQAEGFRKSLGLAPMLGRHWSIATSESESVATALSQALDAAQRRMQLRTTLTSANQRVVATTPVVASEFQRMVTAEYHLSNFLRHSRDAVIGIDRERNVLFWSQGAEALLGTRAVEAVGRPLSTLRISSKALNQALERIDLGEPLVTLEHAITTSSPPQTLELVLSAVPDGVGVSIVARDVSLRRRQEDQLRNSNRTLEDLVAERSAALEQSQLALMRSQKLEAIGKLTGGVAHDFNNVLQIIGSNLQLLQRGIEGDAGLAKLARAALNAVDRGAKLSSQLLAFARKQPLNPSPLNVNKRIQDMGELLRRALGEEIDIETALGGGLWTTLVDPNQLENVVLNLAINARDAMPEGGRLTIETSNAVLDEAYTHGLSEVQPGQYVLVALTDTGTGMAADVMAQAFEPFFTTKAEGLGTGLGLSMAWGFAKQSGGHIRIYSEVGNGTTIKLYLPRSHEKEVTPPAALNGPVAGGTETILVVEDDLDVQAAVVSMLSTLGYTVLRANDAQAGLTILQSGVKVDLLFTDVVMPGPLRSPELVQHAKRLLPGIAVLFTSGYTQNAIVHGGRLDAGVELLSKPYRQEDLARKVRHLLANRSQTLAMPQLLEQATKATASREHLADGSLRVLLVEDLEDLRVSVHEMIEMLGHRVQSVESAEAALPLLENEPFDVLLTDIGLPGMSGSDLALRVAPEHPQMRVVFASGYPSDGPGDLRSWHLLKPYGFEELERVLSQVRDAA